MEKLKLTDGLVGKLEPPSEGSRIVWDAGDAKGRVRGFGLRVTANGVRSFILNYSVKGSGLQRRLTLGQFGSDFKSVSAARSHARELREQIAKGADPLGKLREHRDAPTVNELADRYIEEHAKPKKRPMSVYEDESLLRQWIRPEIGTKKVRDVTRSEIEELHRKITKAGTPGRANRVHALLSKMFSLAIRWEMREDNPTKNIDKNPENKRSRYLKPDELGRLIKALADHPNQEGSNVIRLLMFTGARRGEALGARWDQFDLAEGVWTKPSAMTKQRAEHRVPLSAPALQLISEIQTEAKAGEARAAALEREAAKLRHPKKKAAKINAAARARMCAGSPYVFPGYAEGEPLGNVRRFWIDLCERAEITGLRIHDLRHSYASMLAGAGLSLPVISALLGHTQASTTHRYAHLLDDPLRAATERVGAIITGVATGKTAEVKEFPSKRR